MTTSNFAMMACRSGSGSVSAPWSSFSLLPSRSSSISIMSENGPRKGFGFWARNPEAFELAQKLVANGASASEAASEISRQYNCRVSRNAVIGVFHRANLSIGGGSPKKPGPKKKNASVKATLHGKQAVNRITAPQPASKPLPVVIEKLDPERNVTLTNLEDGMCKWLVDDKLYCGAPVVARRESYCSIHHRTSSVKGYEFNYTKPYRRRGRWS